MTIFDFIIAGLAAVAAGFINALAGGGTLISFPALTFIGIPPVAANITNTIALCPGYLGGISAQSKDLREPEQRKKLWLLIPGALGGLTGGYLLLISGEKLFSELIPYLLFIASGLLALNEPLRKIISKRRNGNKETSSSGYWSSLPIYLAAIYGGYFGAGLSVIVLAVLGLTFEESITKLNALKQAISFSVNTAAAIFFLFSGLVVWPIAVVMLFGSLIGGYIGGRLAGRIKPATLRLVVVTIGFIVGFIYLLR